jgi:hypothetical protein
MKLAPGPTQEMVIHVLEKTFECVRRLNLNAPNLQMPDMQIEPTLGIRCGAFIAHKASTYDGKLCIDCKASKIVSTSTYLPFRGKLGIRLMLWDWPTDGLKARGSALTQCLCWPPTSPSVDIGPSAGIGVEVQSMSQHVTGT